MQGQTRLGGVTIGHWYTLGCESNDADKANLYFDYCAMLDRFVEIHSPVIMGGMGTYGLPRENLQLASRLCRSLIDKSSHLPCR